MPFVPLGSRKNLGVILDHDKERLTNEMRARDNATVKLHHSVMPGQSGYRYANHPHTMGPVRGPAAPFKGANKPWAPVEHDPDGMAALKDSEQAPIGASREGSHEMFGESMRKSRSLPSLHRSLAAHPIEEGGKSLGEQAKEAANPLSIELNRWKRMAEITKRDLASMPELAQPPKREPKPLVITGGLVNFPKYMLFENCYLKQTDMQRYVEQEAQTRREAEERQKRLDEAMASGELKDMPATGRSDEPDVLVQYGTASWGQPRLRGPDETIRNQWAGSSMAAGRAQRTSNPFRMG